MCFFGSCSMVRVVFSGSGFRNKVFLSPGQVPVPECVPFTGSAFRVSVLRVCAMATDLLRPGSLTKKSTSADFNCLLLL